MTTMLRVTLDNVIRRLAQLEVTSSRHYAADTKAAASSVPAPVAAPATTAVAPAAKTAAPAKKDKKGKKKDDIPRDARGWPTVLMGIMKPDDPLVQ